MTIIKTE